MKPAERKLEQGREIKQGEQDTSNSVVSDHGALVPAYNSLSHLEAFFNTPSVIFPSLVSRQEANEVKRAEVDAVHILTSISSSYAIKDESGNIKHVAKRPVGRPRIHPKKELDPNRIRRVARGDKPLGRPRTSHLKPPIVKGPRGRPRKDASKEIFAAPLDEQTKQALTEEWRHTMNSMGSTTASAPPAANINLLHAQSITSFSNVVAPEQKERKEK